MSAMLPNTAPLLSHERDIAYMRGIRRLQATIVGIALSANVLQYLGATNLGMPAPETPLWVILTQGSFMAWLTLVRVVSWKVLATDLLAFCGLATWSLFAVLQGAASCGCFGAVEVSPWVTFAVALLASGGACVNLLVLRPVSHKFAQGSKVLISCVVLGGLTVGAFGFIVTWSHIETVRVLTARRDETTLYDPIQWLDRPFPLQPFIRWTSPPVNTSEGDWLVVIHRRSCQECQILLDALGRTFADSHAPHDEHATRLALVEIGSTTAQPDTPHFARAAVGTLATERGWALHTPLVIRIVDDRVVSAKHSL